MPARFATTGRRARSTVLVFWLSRPGRVEFVVLRAGSCSKVGAFGARGQRGVNRVRFGGRVEGRRLRPGMYTIVPVVYRSNSVTELERVTIQILRPAAKVPLWRRTALVPAQCRSVDHVATNLLAFGSGSPFDSAFTAFARTGTGSGSATPVGGVKGAEATNPDNSDGPNPIAVDADADEDEGIALPAPFGSDGLGGPSSTVALLLLSGLGFAIMALLLLVVRYIRGSWNP